MLRHSADDDDDFESEQGLLQDSSAPAIIDVGETCVVYGTGKAMLFTGRPVQKCCIMWGFEYLPLLDGSIVEVLDVEPTDANIVTVRVLKSFGTSAIENLIGTVKATWLRREHSEEAIAGFIHNFNVNSCCRSRTISSTHSSLIEIRPSQIGARNPAHPHRPKAGNWRSTF